MDSNPISRGVKAYSITTPVYQGPLDLLLQLIERAELDITRLALAQVTDQFLIHIQNLPELSAEEVSAFLVIAARLIQIKSEALLPRPPVREEGEEDLGEALARQLLEYRRYKKIADFLAARENTGFRSYLRVAPPPKIEGVVDMSDLTLTDLVVSARGILLRTDTRSSLDNVVTPPPVTIRQKIGLIARMLRIKSKTTFASLLNGARSRLDVVITFLAMLELIKRQIVRVNQDKTFGDINVEVLQDIDESPEFDLEFED